MCVYVHDRIGRVVCDYENMFLVFFFTNILDTISRIFGDSLMKIEILKKFEDFTKWFLRVFEPNKGVIVDFLMISFLESIHNSLSGPLQNRQGHP